MQRNGQNSDLKEAKNAKVNESERKTCWPFYKFVPKGFTKQFQFDENYVKPAIEIEMNLTAWRHGMNVISTNRMA